MAAVAATTKKASPSMTLVLRLAHQYSVKRLVTALNLRALPD
jgi:hypothetical protein